MVADPSARLEQGAPSLPPTRSRILGLESMPTRSSLFPLRAALAFGCVLPLTGCDQWALRVNSDGILSISIVSDGFQAGDGYRIRAREGDGTTRLLDVPATGRLTYRSASAGPLELTLLAPEHCRVSAPNPRTLTVAADQTVGVTFDVHCGN